jgi:SAM-dependent methyltransferase
MHDTALNIGGLVMRTYCPSKQARILDVGAQDINGTLRAVAPKASEYVGLDYEAGRGVDILLEPGKPWPVEDDHFDLVFATSVLEHDPAFWMTFEAMCRKAKPGGHIYISAPSNGIVHRCPQDYWRFYPDSGLALKEWVARQGLDVTLIESFIAEREADMWNDFCGIFRREPSPEPLNRNYVYLKIPCTNAIVWESKEILNPRTESQDMILIQRGCEEVQKLQDHIGWREHQIAGEKTAWSAERDELVRRAAEASVAHESLAIELASREQGFATGLEKAAAQERDLQRHIHGLEDEITHLSAVVTDRDERIGQLENNLAQRRAEIEEAVADAAKARELQQAAQETVSQQCLRIQQLGREVCEAQDLVSKLIQERAAAEEKAAAFGEQTEELKRINRRSARELSRLQGAVGRLHRSEEKLRWLRKVHALLARRPWWWRILPPSVGRKSQQRRLKRAGLFDRERYLEARPDVRDAGLDPLLHYVVHGMDEPNPRFLGEEV